MYTEYQLWERSKIVAEINQMQMTGPSHEKVYQNE